MILEKYSVGTGDRFGRQGKAQLRALMQAGEDGVDIVPVWNKSHREHTIIGTSPRDVRTEAVDAVRALDWQGSYYVDADHIGMKNVDSFVDASDFFTLDVADFIGTDTGPSENSAESDNANSDVRAFLDRYRKYVGPLSVPGVNEVFNISEAQLCAAAHKFLPAVREAGKTYRYIENAKSRDSFVTEISMDESDTPQTPIEMLFILAAVADEDIPVQTIAPKFTGRFNKGVDYVGDVGQFAKEFEEDLLVIKFAVEEFGLPANLKLSVHSGSDKFSIYGLMGDALRKHDAGLHLKTAGTTWLEELIGLALAGGDGLAMAGEIYTKALARFDELCQPYATVIDIDRDALPSPDLVSGWTGEQYAAALRHDPTCKEYDQGFRQLLHVGYKVAAELGNEYLAAIETFEDIIAPNVTGNIYDRHLRPIFMAGSRH